MQRHHAFLSIAVLLAWSLMPCPSPAAAAPTAAMFHGQVTVAETSGLSITGRAAEACRQLAKEKEGTHFFTAWAFPSCERVSSCHRHNGSAERSPMSIKSRNGRIVVVADGDNGLNFSDCPDVKKDEPSWGVLIFLNQVDKGRCRISAMELLAPDRIYDLGGERLAWLGGADEAQTVAWIRGLLADNAHRDLREDLVFALYLVNGSAALSELIGLARHDPDMAVRKDAIFWLGQKASDAAVKALVEVITSPEILDVKKHAVFALSQLSEDRGTPLLLDIAKKNPSPALRKTAIFWLGQSGDPRALDFFETILLK